MGYCPRKYYDNTKLDAVRAECKARKIVQVTPEDAKRFGVNENRAGWYFHYTEDLLDNNVFTEENGDLKPNISGPYPSENIARNDLTSLQISWNGLSEY